MTHTIGSAGVICILWTSRRNKSFTTSLCTNRHCINWIQSTNISLHLFCHVRQRFVRDPLYRRVWSSFMRCGGTQDRCGGAKGRCMQTQIRYSRPWARILVGCSFVGATHPSQLRHGGWQRWQPQRGQDCGHKILAIWSQMMIRFTPPLQSKKLHEMLHMFESSFQLTPWNTRMQRDASKPTSTFWIMIHHINTMLTIPHFKHLFSRH